MNLRLVLVSSWMCLNTISLTAAAGTYCSMQQPMEASKGPKVKVLLEKDVTSAFLEAKGGFKVIRKDSGSLLSSGSVGKRFVVHALQHGLRWGEEYPDIYQISLIPLSEETTFLINGIQYQGAISIYHVRDNKITIVNEISIEEFLKSTLSLCYEAPLEGEALAALVIAARTEVFNKALQGQSHLRPWDIAAHEFDYYGCGMTQRESAKAVLAAIDWTKHMIVETKKSNSAPSPSLSQTKAEELAKKGYNAQKILKHSFPQAQLTSTLEEKHIR